MLEAIIIISLSLIFIILLRRLPEIKIEGADEEDSRQLGVRAIIQEVDREFNDKKRRAIRLLSEAEDCFMSKDYSRAEECYLKIATLDPENSLIYGRLGIIYLEQKNFRDASDAFCEAIRREPKNSFWYNNLGLVSFQMGEFGKSVAAHRKAIELNPTAAKYINLARAYEEMKNYPEAILAVNSALELEPSRREYQKTLVDLQAKMNLKD